MRVKQRPNSKEWTKATVDKEVHIRSYQVHTEDGRNYRRNCRHLRQTREPFIKALFVEFSTDLSQQQQPKGLVHASSVSVPEVPTDSSVIQPESFSVQTTRSGHIVFVFASGVSTSEPAVTVTTTRSGRVVRKPARYDS